MQFRKETNHDIDELVAWSHCGNEDSKGQQILMQRYKPSDESLSKQSRMGTKCRGNHHLVLALAVRDCLFTASVRLSFSHLSDAATPVLFGSMALERHAVNFSFDDVLGTDIDGLQRGAVGRKLGL